MIKWQPIQDSSVDLNSTGINRRDGKGTWESWLGPLIRASEVKAWTICRNRV